MGGRKYIAVRNTLIKSAGYSPEKRLEVALLFISQKQKSKCVAIRSYQQLKQLSGIRSNTTLRRAIVALQNAGIIKTVRHFKAGEVNGAPLNDKNSYVIDSDLLEKEKAESGYTLIPRELMTLGLSNAQFAVALVLYMYAGAKRCAWPSISHIAKLLKIARSTVCLALGALRKMSIFNRILRRYCGRLRGKTGYRCNNYFPTNTPFVRLHERRKTAQKSAVLSCYGSPNIGQQDINNSRIDIKRKRIHIKAPVFAMLSAKQKEPPKDTLRGCTRKRLDAVRRRQGGSLPFFKKKYTFSLRKEGQQGARDRPRDALTANGGRSPTEAARRLCIRLVKVFP